MYSTHWKKFKVCVKQNIHLLWCGKSQSKDTMKRKFCKKGMVSTRAAGGTACSQTRLKSETCTSTEPSRGRGQREKKHKWEKESKTDCPSWRKTAKYAASRHTMNCTHRKSGKWRNIDVIDDVYKGG